MNINLIEDYVRRLTKDDIVRFSLKQDITLNNEEVSFIYDYIKKEYKTIIFGNPKDIFKEVKSNVRESTYNKMVALYTKYQEKLELLAKTIREGS